MGVSCSADRQIVGKINDKGVLLEQLETNPGKYLPEVLPEHLGGDVVKVGHLNLKTLEMDVARQSFVVALDQLERINQRSLEDAFAISYQNQTLVHRYLDRGPRHCPRQAQRASR